MHFWLPFGNTEVPIAVPDENLAGFLKPAENGLCELLDRAIDNSTEYAVQERSFIDAAKRSNGTVIAFNHQSVACTKLAERLSRALVQSEAKAVVLLEAAQDPTQPRCAASASESESFSCPPTVHEPSSSPTVNVGQLERGADVMINQVLCEAEARCTIASVAVNPFWGYSGGPTLIVPGLASDKTIKNCIGQASRVARNPAVLSGNVTYETLAQASQMVRVHLGVHVVESTEGKVHGVFAGDFLETFREAVALNEQVFRFSIDRRADIVIVSAGGAQWDRTLFDASPAAMIVSNACKDRGVIILVAECAEGLGKLPSTQPVTRDSKAHRLQVRKTFTLERLMEHALRRLSAEHRVYLVSTLPEHQASLYGLLPAGSVGIALQRALRHVNKEASVVVVPNGSLTAPIVR